MTTVFRILRHTDLVAAESKVNTYQALCEARPAFKRVLGAQMAAFEKGLKRSAAGQRSCSFGRNRRRAILRLAAPALDYQFGGVTYP